MLVAVGANLPSRAGPPDSTILQALEMLDDSPLGFVTASRLFTTPCFPAGAGPDYVNAAIGLSSDLPASEILVHLHRIESHFGRERNERWGQRTLDLDLLAVDDQVLPNTKVQTEWRELPISAQKTLVPDQLVLPHPRMQDRAFVLVPLAEIAGEWVHPLTGLNVDQMLDALPEVEKKAIRPL